MNPTSFSFNSLDSYQDDLNAYISGLLNQQGSCAPSASCNGGLTSAETSFCGDLLPDLTWDDYFLITEDLLLEGAPNLDTPAGVAPGISNINISGGPSTCNLSAASERISMPVGPRMFDPSTGSIGIGVPVGLQTTNGHPSYLECGNGGFSSGINVGGSMETGEWVGTGQQIRQQINGIHEPLALPSTYLEIPSRAPKRPNPPPTPPAPPPTPQPQQRERALSSAAMPNLSAASESLSPPKRSRSSSPSARPPLKPRQDWRKGPEPTFRFIHDERSMPPNFRANPDNHGRFQYTVTGRRKYLNSPGAVQERRRRREGNQCANQQGANGVQRER